MTANGVELNPPPIPMPVHSTPNAPSGIFTVLRDYIPANPFGNFYSTAFENLRYLAVDCIAKPVIDNAPEWTYDNPVVESALKHRTLTLTIAGTIAASLFIYFIYLLHPKAKDINPPAKDPKTGDAATKPSETSASGATPPPSEPNGKDVKVEGTKDTNGGSHPEKSEAKKTDDPSKATPPPPPEDEDSKSEGIGALPSRMRKTSSGASSKATPEKTSLHADSALKKEKKEEKKLDPGAEKNGSASTASPPPASASAESGTDSSGRSASARTPSSDSTKSIAGKEPKDVLAPPAGSASSEAAKPTSTPSGSDSQVEELEAAMAEMLAKEQEAKGNSSKEATGGSGEDKKSA